MPPSLRPTEPSDRGFCEELTRSNMARYLAALHEPWDPRRYQDNWQRFDKFIILDERTPAGVLMLLQINNVLEIRDLQLLPAQRGRGIGSWAVAQAIALANERHLAQLRLRVFVENPAKRLYARLGFELIGIDAHMLQMALRLPPA